LDPGKGGLLEAMTAMRVCKLTLIIFFVFAATCGFAKTAQKTQEKEWLSYQPTVVKLEGTLSVKTYYGPPNYGENPDTDAKEELPILILSKPVNVRGNPDPKAGFDKRSVEDLREMQLVLTMPHKEFIGKTVFVKGNLFHAFTAHHHTDVLMDVRSIKLDPEGSLNKQKENRGRP
jgi:Domain of unknown function (DUF4431)